MILPHNLVYTPTNHPKDNWSVDRLPVMPAELLFDTACTLCVLCFPCTGGSPTSSRFNTRLSTEHCITQPNSTSLGSRPHSFSPLLYPFSQVLCTSDQNTLLSVFAPLCSGFMELFLAWVLGCEQETRRRWCCVYLSISALVRASTHYSERLAEAV